MIESNSEITPILTDPAYKAQFRDKYLNPLVNVINGGFATLNQDQKDNTGDQVMTDGINQELEMKKMQLSMLQVALNMAMEV